MTLSLFLSCRSGGPAQLRLLGHWRPEQLLLRPQPGEELLPGLSPQSPFSRREGHMRKLRLRGGSWTPT